MNPGNESVPDGMDLSIGGGSRINDRLYSRFAGKEAGLKGWTKQ
jgi:hypothetical protein